MFFRSRKDFDTNNIQSVINACLQNNHYAQRSLVESYLPYAKTVCLIYSKNEMDVQEMLNDGFIKVFKNLSKYDFSRPFKAWIRAIFIHNCMDHYRKNKTLNYNIPIEEITDHGYETNIIDDLAADELLQLIKILSPVYRMVFTLYVVEGYNHREIADILGIQEGTSKSNLRDARKKLQQMITQKYGNHFISLKKIRS